METKQVKTRSYDVTMTLTKVWDPEAAALIQEGMVQYLLIKAPELATRRAAELAAANAKAKAAQGASPREGLDERE